MQVSLRSPPIGSAGLQHVVSALRSLGYRARLVTDSQEDYFGFVADSRNKVQIGFYGWVADSPDASRFFDPMFRCSGFSPADPRNANPSEFCDQSIDRLMDQAGKLQESSPAAASAVWAQVDRRIVDAAPWIPLISPTWTDVLAPRVHNYQRSPVLGVLFDQMWVD